MNIKSGTSPVLPNEEGPTYGTRMLNDKIVPLTTGISKFCEDFPDPSARS